MNEKGEDSKFCQSNSTWDKYMLVEKETDLGTESKEIKISNKPNNFKGILSYAIKMLEDEEHEKVVLKATG